MGPMRDELLKANGRRAFRCEWVKTGRDLRAPGSPFRLHCPLIKQESWRKDISVPMFGEQCLEAGVPA